MSEMIHAARNSITVSLAISQKIKVPKKLLILKKYLFRLHPENI